LSRSVEAKTTLIEILELSRKYNLSYIDFFSLFIGSYGHTLHLLSKIRRDIAENIVAKIRKLTGMVIKSPDTLSTLRNRALQLKYKGYQPFLVDCLGLPEVYEIYKRITDACGHLSVVVEPYVNVTGLTYRFRSTFQASSMLELARMLSTSLYGSIDLVVHNELSNPLELDVLIKHADAKLRVYVDELARDAMSKHNAFIVSDHGYDLYHTNGKYYLDHGGDSKLAKIAPLIIVNC